MTNSVMPWIALKYIALALPSVAMLLLLSKRSKRRSAHEFQGTILPRKCRLPRNRHTFQNGNGSWCASSCGESQGGRRYRRVRLLSFAKVDAAIRAAVVLLSAINSVKRDQTFNAAKTMTVGRMRMGETTDRQRHVAKSYLAGKIVWVTGASSGLGEQLAIAAAEGGAKGVILSGRRHDALERVRQACEAAREGAGVGDHVGAPAAGGGVRVLPFDVGELDGLAAQAKKAVEEFGRVDILALNAGVSTRASVEDTTVEVAKRVMAVNYFGAVALAKGLLTAQTTKPGVRAGPHFVVINSVQGKFGMAHRSSYCASKHALIGFFDCLRAETAHLGVRVTTVLPGYVRTSLSLNALTGDGSQHSQMDKATASGRDPREVADAVWTAVGKGRDEVVIADLRVKLAVLLRAVAPQTLFGIMAKRALKGGEK